MAIGDAIPPTTTRHNAIDNIREYIIIRTLYTKEKREESTDRRRMATMRCESFFSSQVSLCAGESEGLGVKKEKEESVCAVCAHTMPAVCAAAVPTTYDILFLPKLYRVPWSTW